MSDWQSAASILWGADWIAPLSETINVNRRTVERWKAGQGEPRPHVAEALVTLARRAGYDAHHVGRILREMAAGATMADVDEDAQSHLRAAKRVRADTNLIERLTL